MRETVYELATFQAAISRGVSRTLKKYDWADLMYELCCAMKHAGLNSKEYLLISELLTEISCRLRKAERLNKLTDNTHGQ